MTPTGAYLQRVARGLSGMDPRLREDVLRELRSHLADAAVAGGESAALAAAEAPESVAARYRELYGYGAAYQAAFTTVAAFLAVLTVPVFVYAVSVPASLIASLFLLVVLAAYLMIVADYRRTITSRRRGPSTSPARARAGTRGQSGRRTPPRR